MGEVRGEKRGLCDDSFDDDDGGDSSLDAIATSKSPTRAPVTHLRYRSLQAVPLNVVYSCRDEQEMLPLSPCLGDTQASAGHAALRSLQQLAQHGRELVGDREKRGVRIIEVEEG